MKRKLHYEPLEIQAAPEDGLFVAKPQTNPRKRVPQFSNYDGLQVKIALVRAPGYTAAGKPIISDARKVVDVVAHMVDEVVENMLVLILDSRHRVTGVYEAVRGQISGVTVMAADLLRPVLAAGADRFIIVHNHPSGAATPSAEDDALTKQVSAAAKCIAIAMLDHIIVGKERDGNGRPSYYSYADAGKL